MDFELDHLFICVSAGALREADRLVALGLTEGAANTHPGQGTACRRFFFANAFLELLWVDNPAEAQSEIAWPLRLWERWSGRQAGACPFGVCVRPAHPDVRSLPFTGWQYRPPYLPAPLSFHIANSSPQEASLIHLPFGRRPDARPPAEQQPMRHALGVGEITGILFAGPRLPSQEDTVLPGSPIAFQQGEEHLAEITFDSAQAGRWADLRPLLPLIIRW